MEGTLAKRSAEVRVDPLVPLSEAHRAVQRRAADAYGRFLGSPVEVRGTRGD